MAKFRDSTVDRSQLVEATDQAHAQHRPNPALATLGLGGGRADTDEGGAQDASNPVLDRRIGDILAERRGLTPEQIEQVLLHQREKGIRFGEAAVAMGLVSKDDVLFALSQQFHYAYAPEEKRVNTPELVTLNEPFSVRAEYFRALRTQLTMRAFAEGEVRRAIAFISPNTGDGKTYCAANLAVTLAQLGGRTLLVDADMRGPRIHQVFGLSNKTGLSAILSGRADRQVIQQVSGVPSLYVLPVGTTPPNPLELVERPAFGLLMREFASKFDHVLVDTPAAIFGSDAFVIAARCGQALVVARKHKARVTALQNLMGAISQSSIKLVGAVMNEY